MNELPEDNRSAVRVRLQASEQPHREPGQVDRRTYFTRQAISEFIRGGVASTLMERQYKSGDDLVVEEPVVYPGVGITSKENANNPQPGDPAPSLTTDSRNYMVDKKRKYIVRRLTPTECARLQGFPDWWCYGANGSDSAMYKLWGNGIALPCAEDVLGRVARALREDTDEPM